MKIIRNGQEFELTLSELIDAHNEYEIDSTKEDVRSKLADIGISLSDEQLALLARKAVHNLTKNDGYFESYWGSIDCTISEWLESMEE